MKKKTFIYAVLEIFKIQSASPNVCILSNNNLLIILKNKLLSQTILKDISFYIISVVQNSIYFFNI